MSEKLKPCPFCGSDAYAKVGPYQFPPDHEGGAWTWGYSVVCDASGLEGSEKGCGSSSAWAETSDEAVEAWNRRADGWQPIETAPKDGRSFLATHETSGIIRISWFGKTSHVPLYGWCQGEDGEDIDLWKPTHWQPLPAAPEVPT